MAAEAVVSVTVETLGNLLTQEERIPRGVKDRVEGLRTEFCHIQSLLKDADREQHDSETIRNWIKEMRLLAYRAEDLVEEYVVKTGYGNGDLAGFINILKRFVCFANVLPTFHNLFGSEIQGIKSHITGHMNEFGIQHLISHSNKRRSFIRETYSHSHQELQHFVGMDEDIKKLVSLLVDDQESRHRVIGVWGVGGSGKTTVANEVYKNVHVKRFFDSFAWVCITRKRQIQSVMQDILWQLLPAERNNYIEDTNELEEKIYSVQMEKKCLIVLDDIWKFHDWKCLSKCFPNFVSQSKVLLITRSGDVAEIGYPIQLKGFTEDEAWELLRDKVLANIDLDEAWDESEYEKLGRKMIRKCERLPLAVAVMGGILSGKNSLEEWKLASEDVNAYIGRGHDERGEVKEVLGLSYDELPYHLKPCFLSLGFLQEDESAKVEKIYHLWMAEGLIQSKHVGINGETMSDVAKLYLYELQFRSMVQLSDDLSVLSLHDSILDFCRSKAKEEEFLMVVDKGDIISDQKAYRLVMHVDDEDNDLEVLRSAENISTPLRCVQIIRKPFSNFINLPKMIFYLPQFKSLRILIFVSYGLSGKCFRGIENLIHLRLLGLMDCEWEMFSLERWVDKLSFLQTLDLSNTTVSLVKLDAFCKMRQLRHLYLPSFPDGFRIQGKLRLINLSQLETLYHLQSEYHELKDLIHLQRLRTLGCTITDDESLVQITDYMCRINLRWIYMAIRYCDRSLSDSLGKLVNIPNVTLELDIESCMLLKLPPLETLDFSRMSPGLVKLSIGHTDIAEDIMQSLDKFPNLKILHLESIRFSGKEMICDGGSFKFPRLEELSLFSVEGEFELRIDEAAMPNLSSMDIVCCSGINFMIPQRLRLFARIDHFGSCVFN